MNNWFLLAAIPVFGLLVFVHELGHFLTAKWAGIRVEEFGLGLPPRIVGIRKRARGGWQVVWFSGRNEQEDSYTGQEQADGPPRPETHHTIYSLNLLPIGGFVRMPGENGELYDEGGRYDPGSFAAKSAGKRIIVLVAGVTMNFLMAMVLFSFAYSLGEPTLLPIIAQVVPHSPAADAGMRPGDTILSVNGQPVQQFNDVVTITQTAVNDAASHNQQTAPLKVVVKHKGQAQPVTLTVNARVHPPSGQGSMGVAADSNKVIYQTYPIWQAPIKGIQQTFTVTGEFISGIVQMITGAIKPQIMGPVGIVQVTGEVAQSVPTIGWFPILSLTGILSLNLAIVNIIPFPALDGGRILLILIELLRGGKRLKPEREGLINLVGMALLLTLIIVVTFSDVVHWGAR